MAEYLIPIFVILFLIVVNGVFVAAEFAIVSAPYARIARRAEQGSRAATAVVSVLKDNNRRDGYIATAQIGITVASLGLGMYGEATLAHWLEEPLARLGILSPAAVHTVAFVIAVTMLTYLHVVLGEMIPKSLAIQSAETTVLQLARPMALIQKVLSPLVFVLNTMGNAITRMLGVPPAAEQDRLYSPEELEYLVEESATGGELEPRERLYLENIFDFSERSVGQVMTPRNRITGISVDAGDAEIFDIICDAPFTRFPVYDGSLDAIVGIVHVKSLARQQVNGDDETRASDAADIDLSSLVSPPVFIPETALLQNTLAELRKQGKHMGIVIDEYGGVAGLVTIEDIMEEVVGEIRDEFDRELPPMQALEPGVIRVRGDLILDELNQHFNLDLGIEDVETVGGLIMAKVERVPRPGDRVEVAGAVFEVEEMMGLAVMTARVVLPEAGGVLHE